MLLWFRLQLYSGLLTECFLYFYYFLFWGNSFECHRNVLEHTHSHLALESVPAPQGNARCPR